MKLGVFTPLFGELSLEETLKKLNSLGVKAVELGAGGYPGNAHLPVDELLSNTDKANEIFCLLDKYGMEISALSCHGNPVHPDKMVAQGFHRDFEKAVLAAEKLSVSTIVTFSGCPGDCIQSKYPNWVTCPWPNDFGKILEYKRNKILNHY